MFCFRLSSSNDENIVVNEVLVLKMFAKQTNKPLLENEWIFQEQPQAE